MNFRVKCTGPLRCTGPFPGRGAARALTGYSRPASRCMKTPLLYHENSTYIPRLLALCVIAWLPLIGCCLYLSLLPSVFAMKRLKDRYVFKILTHYTVRVVGITVKMFPTPI